MGRGLAANASSLLFTMFLLPVLVYINEDGGVKVGIIGAGAAGLYAGLIIDSLADPRITYDIFDADPMTDRKGGGRLYTYDFPNGGVNDYFVSLFAKRSLNH